ncbi:MFS transporter [Bacillaceae bacterium SAOS 7]|nr:MFS transporter [Bacillaceae bacterium SAOS 7]
MIQVKEQHRFWILVSIVAISGFSQGMLLPVISIIFEQEGVSSSLNGLHASALYIGILFVSPFMEKPLRQYGYKPVIISGGLLVIISLLCFPLWKSYWFWFLLRLLIGIGDHTLHFGTQTWITSFSPEHRRGRNISLYGLFFGVGFALGPLMTSFIKFNEALPFIVSSVLCLCCWGFLFLLKNDFPEQSIQTNSFMETLKRFREASRYGWIAFLPTFGYGFLESSLNGIFPIYGVRNDLSIQQISVLLMTFALGGIIFQFPLGMMSDKYGRKRVLGAILTVGCILFFVSSLIMDHYYVLLFMLFVTGMVVGSTFSTGISFMTDLMPKHLLPTGNLLCGMSFSIGSLTGPYAGGLMLQMFEEINFFMMISVIFFFLAALFMVYNFQHTEKKITSTIK